MSARELVDRSFALGRRLADGVVQPLAPLLTRLVLGHAFFLTGRGKWGNLDGVTGLFQDQGIPFPAANAVFISMLELVGGICLMLGLGTRVFAALLASTMVVALITADRASFLSALSGSGDQGLTDVVPVVFLLFLVWLVGHGAGPISLDRVLAKRLLPRSAAPAVSH